MLPDYLRVAHFDYCSSNLYILVDGDEALLVDAHVGTEAEEALKSIEAAVGDHVLREVVLTH